MLILPFSKCSPNRSIPELTCLDGAAEAARIGAADRSHPEVPTLIRERAAVPLIVVLLATGVISLGVAVWIIIVGVKPGPAALELPALTVEAAYPGATAAVAEEKLAARLKPRSMASSTCDSCARDAAATARTGWK